MSPTSTPFRSFLRKAWRWQPGRQGSGYDKMLLLESLWPLPFDVYVLRYTLGSGIAPHTDPVAQGRHYRCNIVIWEASQGGRFVCRRTLFSSRRLHVFRPDAEEHWVEPVTQGRRYVVSIGWLRR